MYFKTSGEVSWWRLQDILTTKNLLFYWSEGCFTLGNKKYWTPVFVLFQLFRKIKIAGSYEDKPLLALQKLRRRLSFVSLRPFLETILWSESLISRIFKKPNRFWSQKIEGKIIDWRQKEMLGKMHKIIK